jgi:murein DD-endopeptidase MepM/ murein hydrolase activator NlpD
MAAGSPIVAPGAGVVIRIGSDPGTDGKHFGPSYPVVKFTSGPYAGKIVYIGHTTSKLKVGKTFKPGDVISLTGSGGPESGGAPPGWAEIGFAPGGNPGGKGQPPPF